MLQQCPGNTCMQHVHGIDQFHKSQNAPVPYPTMLHSEQKCAYFCSDWSIVRYGTGAFWDLWIRLIVHTVHGFVRFSQLLGPWDILMKFSRCNFQTDFDDWWWRLFFWNCPNINVTGLHWWSVNIGSGNGLVPSGNKPLPEPMLTQISVAIWCR